MSKMFHNRPCGCKGQRSCLLCEKEHGAWNVTKNITDDEKEGSYIYCPLCDLAWPGWDENKWKEHPHHTGNSISMPGVEVCLNFISEEDEQLLLKQLDEVPWDSSQSGRLKQNYGPKCNFKKRKVKLDGFIGYPQFTKYVQDRFESLGILKDFKTVEQCSLDYTINRGSSIDFHIDDCWIWGERIPTLSLLSDSLLTLSRYSGDKRKYNLMDVASYPARVGVTKNVRSVQELSKFYMENDSDVQSYLFPSEYSEDEKSQVEILPNIVRVPMPARSLLVLYGHARYAYEHAVLREDIDNRRVCITYRELTPTFLACGPKNDVGGNILEVSRNFKDHREMYDLPDV